MAAGLQDQGVVVTGAGRGIGRALATRAAAEGARVVVNDLNPATARAVADEIGGTAVPGDASSAEGVAALIDTATDALGRIDVYCANAGIDGAGWRRCCVTVGFQGHGDFLFCWAQAAVG